ncbi:MAG TPA: hypothetical protein VLU92_02885 [Candidatus Dormibacteraeota bacterium]|nr:hypothetical protein [Candidatus Dormibacteraeota bacterium]
MKKRLVVGTLAAGVMLVAGQATASANVMWCLSDPPIQLVTPGGHNITVNNMIYMPPVYRHLMSQVSDDASAAPDGHGGTLVTVNVRIPSAVSQAHVVSSNNRYQVSTEAGAQGGVVVTLHLDLPTT